MELVFCLDFKVSVHQTCHCRVRLGVLNQQGPLTIHQRDDIIRTANPSSSILAHMSCLCKVDHLELLSYVGGRAFEVQ